MPILTIQVLPAKTYKKYKQHPHICGLSANRHIARMTSSPAGHHGPTKQSRLHPTRPANQTILSWTGVEGKYLRVSIY